MMNAKVVTTTTATNQVLRMAGALAALPQGEFPLKHSFVPGFYVRQIFMPKGSLIVSRKHLTEHPFVISQGHAAVWDEHNGVRQLQAPFCGITPRGTQRVLFIHEDCVWTTFHAGSWPADTDPAKIVAALTEAQELPPAECLEAEILRVLQTPIPKELTI